TVWPIRPAAPMSSTWTRGSFTPRSLYAVASAVLSGVHRTLLVRRIFALRTAHATANTSYRFVSNSSSVLRRRAWFASLISHNGKRTSDDIVPRQASAVFTGTGLGSINKSLNTGSSCLCDFSANLKSPDSHVRTRAHTSDGNKFEATLTTPAAPTAINGSVSESSPLTIGNASGKRRRNAPTRSTLPLVSLIDTMLRHSLAKRATVSGTMSTP